MTAERKRAQGMTPEHRREMIIRTALPLVAEHGTAVTTAQIARSAGIGEATIFRVFPDKEALLNACVAEVLDVSQLLGELTSISLEEPLEERLIQAADALQAHLARMGQVVGALLASGHNRRPKLDDPEDEATRHALSANRDSSRTETLEAVMTLLQPDVGTLRLSIEKVAELFCMQASQGFAHMNMNETSIDTRELVSLFLYGVFEKEAQ